MGIKIIYGQNEKLKKNYISSIKKDVERKASIKGEIMSLFLKRFDFVDLIILKDVEKLDFLHKSIYHAKNFNGDVIITTKEEMNFHEINSQLDIEIYHARQGAANLEQYLFFNQQAS